MLSPPDFGSGKHAGLQTRGGGSGSALHSAACAGAVGSLGCSRIRRPARSACGHSSERDIASMAASGSRL